MPKGVNDPHTLVFNRQDNIWFTAQQSNRIGLLDVDSGQVKIATPQTANSRPYGIKVDSQNRPWVALFGTNKLAWVDPKTMVVNEISIPRPNARPRRLEIDPSNNIWYVDYPEGYLGRYTPSTKDFKEWKLPTENPRPYGTALDNRGRLWIADTGKIPNIIFAFDIKTEKFISQTPVPSGGNIRHMYFDSKDGSFWFGVDSGFLDQGIPKD
ncbi:hypothetical protein [uncultured Microbulbifer sp.]|uniref:Vgb family protein n=1 Tax=uncultured Microbulbifer sp. TaxID=348147 RepID=UPI0026245FE0|nr:hypothetical protein [uncultured Microbulbifer sp.]